MMNGDFASLSTSTVRRGPLAANRFRSRSCRQLPSAYCTLRTAYCILCTAYCVLRSAFCRPHAACRVLHAGHGPLTTDASTPRTAVRGRSTIPLTTCCPLAPTYCLLLAFFPLAAQAEGPRAVPVDGEPFAGELVSIDSEWEITFGGEGSSRTMPAAELLHWGQCAEIRQGPVLVLADGGLLIAEVFQADRERLTADSDLLGLAEIPLGLLAGVVFQLPADRHARDLLLDRVAEAEVGSDVLILNNEDEVAGEVEGLRDDAIRVSTLVGPVDVQTHRVRALVFQPALPPRRKPEGLQMIAGFEDGSWLLTSRLVVGEGALEIAAGEGLRLRAAADDLVWLQPLGGRVTYLSDLEVDDYRQMPFFDLRWPCQTDRNVTGGMLRSAGRLHRKGLGVHSAARLTYRLSQPYRRFQAELAIDDGTHGRGSVRFHVFVDGSPKYTSPVVRGSTATVPVSVDLSGAQQLDLVVDFGDRADELDHANWLDARLVR